MADAQLTKIPTPTQCKEFCHMLHNMQIRKTERSHMWLIRFHWLFLLQSRLSDSIEQYNEPPRYRFHRDFAKSLFVVKSTKQTSVPSVHLYPLFLCTRYSSVPAVPLYLCTSAPSVPLYPCVPLHPLFLCTPVPSAVSVHYFGARYMRD